MPPVDRDRAWRAPASGAAGPSVPVGARVAFCLEALRAELNEHLDRLEALARAQATSGGSPAAMAPLQERVRQLEAEIAHRQDEDEGRRRQWHDQLSQLESDRQMLAQAWEQIERERIAGRPSGGGGAEVAPARTPATATPARPALAAPTLAGATGDDPISRAILSQFQAVRRDVRQAASHRNL